jgi:hypothetical protein
VEKEQEYVLEKDSEQQQLSAVASHVAFVLVPKEHLQQQLVLSIDPKLV